MRASCSVASCDRSAYARGFCRFHYERSRKGRDVQVEAPPIKPMPARTVEWLMDRVEQVNECWLWRGRRSAYGYGVVDVGGRTTGAHRLSYELHVGPIPEGLEIDHLCRVRNCIRPDHLEPVTHAENVRRSFADQSACARGHEFNSENSYVRSDGRRQCRVCARDLDAARRARRRNAAIQPRCCP